MSTPRYRALRFGVTRVALRHGADGAQYLLADQDLQPYAHRMTDRLLHWAEAAPDRTWMARRVRLADGGTGEWRHVSYAQALASARSIAQALDEPLHCGQDPPQGELRGTGRTGRTGSGGRPRRGAARGQTL